MTASEKSSTNASGASDWTVLNFPYFHFVPKSTERKNLNFPTDTIAFFPNNSNAPLVMTITNDEDKSSLVLIDPEKLEQGSTEFGDPEILNAGISTLSDFYKNASKCKYVRSVRVDKNQDGDLVQKIFNA